MGFVAYTLILVLMNPSNSAQYNGPITSQAVDGFSSMEACAEEAILQMQERPRTVKAAFCVARK